MQKRLPLKIEPAKVAQKRLDYMGMYPKSLMRCLPDSVASIDSDINASFSFTTDTQRLSVIDLIADVKLSLVCQRCGTSFDYFVHIERKLSPVKNDEQAKSLPERYDPIELDEFGEIDLVALVEDEIILSLPVVPVHEISDCAVSEADWVFGKLPEEAQKPNLFAKLEKLKKK